MKLISRNKFYTSLLFKTVLSFTLFIPVSVKAQEYNQWGLTKVVDNNNGLLQNSIGSLYFDTQTGFLWMTTEAGLVRYDGQGTFVFDKRMVPDMPTVRMSAIYSIVKEGVVVMDRSGMLYKIAGAGVKISTNDSIRFPKFLNAPFTGNFPTLRMANTILDNLPANEKEPGDKFDISQFPLSIASINDSIWVSYSSAFLKVFKHTQAIAEWKKRPGELPVLIRSDKFVYALNNDGSGYQVNVQNLVCRKLTCTANSFLNGEPKIYYDQVNNQPLLMNGNKLYRIVLNDTVITANHIATLVGMPESIKSIVVHPTGNTIFVGSQLSGLFIYTKNPFRTYKAAESTHNIGKQNIARNNVYAAVVPDPDHVMTSTSVLFNLNTGSYTIAPFEIERKSVMLLDNKQNIWYASSDTLFRSKYDAAKPDKQFSIALNRTPSSQALNFLNALYQSAAGKIWVSTYEFLGYIKDDKLIKYMLHTEENSPRFYYMTESSKGQIIGSNDAGIFYLDTIKKRLVKFSNVSVQSVRSVYIDTEDYCWITTYGNGMYVYNLTSREFSKLPVDQNGYLLFSHAVCDDGKGNFIIPTNRGLFRINRKHLLDLVGGKSMNLLYHYFDVRSGLESNEFNGGCQPLFNKLKNGDILFPSLSGLVKVNIDGLPDPHNYSLFIDKIETKHKTYINIDQQPQFAANERNQTWFISFPQWDQFYSHGFSYKLDTDKDWTYLAEGERQIKLSDLAGGNHTLHIRFQAGLLSEKFSSLVFPFYVNKKYYEKAWFWLLIVFLFFTILYFIARLHTINLTRKNALLERKVNEKTSELVEKNEELANTLLDLENTIHELNEAMESLQKNNLFKTRLMGLLGHDVLIPLQYIAKVSGQLKSYSEKISKETTLESLGDINNTASQLEFFGESIIHWIKLQNNEYRPIIENFLVSKIINDLAILHRELLAEKGNALINEVSPDLYFLQDATLVKTILHNLLLNANKFTSNGKVTISAEVKEDWLTVYIKDNGKGMDQDKVNSLNSLQPILSSLGTQMETGWGMGYVLIIDLLKYSKGSLLVESNENTGTLVTVKFPSGKYMWE